MLNFCGLDFDKNLIKFDNENLLKELMDLKLIPISKELFENNFKYPNQRNNKYKNIYENEENLKNLLLGNYNYFKEKNGLENFYLENIDEDFLKFEKNYNFGDYCMVFYNPDFKIINKNNTISIRNAIKLYFNLFKTDFKNLEEDNFFKKLSKAFLYVFLLLDSSESDEENDIFKINIFDKSSYKKKKINKKIFNGNYFEKNTKKINIDYLKQNDTEIVQWLRTKNLTKDFSTLLRNLYLIILGYNGYLVRSFINTTGEIISLVIYRKQINMKKLATITNINKKLDLSIIDFLSFEPVDKTLRPLRVNHILWNKKLWIRAYPNDELVQIKKGNKTYEDSKKRIEIIDYIKNKINFKSLYNRIKWKWSYKESYFNLKTLVKENKKIKLKVWNRYLLFLKKLYIKKEEIDKEYDYNLIKIKRIKLILTKNTHLILKKKFKILKIKNIKNYFSKFKNQMEIIINDLNKENKKKLKNIWTTKKIKPKNPYMKYIDLKNTRKNKLKFLNNIIWKYDKLDVKNEKIDLFEDLEILKMINIHLNGIFNFRSIINFNDEYISDHTNLINSFYFPLHDYLKILGKKYANNCEQFIDYKLKKFNLRFNQKIELVDDLELYSLLNEKQKKIISMNEKLKEYEEKIKINNTKEVVKKKKFTNPPKWPLKKYFNINFFLGLNKGIYNIKYYFGEIYAIYYKFLSFCLILNYPMIVLFIPYLYFTIVNRGNYFSNNNFGLQLFHAIIFGFSFLYPLILYINWSNIEKRLNFEFGNDENIKLEKTLRNEFQSNFVRDFISDELNILDPHINKTNFKKILTLFITLILIGISFYTTIIILDLKIRVVRENLLTNIKYESDIFKFDPVAILFNLFEITKNFLFSLIFKYIIYFLLKFESHKYAIDYQNSFIFKISLFEILINTFFLFLIVFFGYEDSILVKSLDISKYYLFMYFNFYFLFSLIKFFFNFILIKVEIKKIKELFINENNNAKNINKMFEKMNKSVSNNKKFLLLNENYKNINSLIERQIYFKDNKNSSDLNNDFLEIIKILSILSLFGIWYPLCYLFFGLIIMLEYFNDKTLLLFIFKRPYPNNLTTIGIWKNIIKIISSFSIITNLYIFFNIFFRNNNNFYIFLIYIFSATWVYLIFDLYSKKKDPVYETLKKRNEFIKDKVLNNFSKKKLNKNKVIKVNYSNSLTNIKINILNEPKKNN